MAARHRSKFDDLNQRYDGLLSASELDGLHELLAGHPFLTRLAFYRIAGGEAASFDDLETRREVIDLLGRAEQAEGVRVFIGSENKLFSLSGSSTIVAPYHNASGQIVGVRGVITHAIDDDAVKFYRRLEFVHCPLGERVMLFTVEKLHALFATDST